MATTPIRQLMLMRDKTDRRSRALDEAERRDDLSREEWAMSSRAWSRQHEALACAIVAEPPQSTDDVLAVLTQLAGLHDRMVGQRDDATVADLRDLHESPLIAVANCALRLAAIVRPEEEPTDAQHEDLVWLQKRADCWLPKQEGC